MRCARATWMTTRCTGWGWPRRSTRWRASSRRRGATGRAGGEARWPTPRQHAARRAARRSLGLEVNRWLAEHHGGEGRMLTMSEDHDTLTALRDGGEQVPRQRGRAAARRARPADGRRRRRRARSVLGPGRHRASPRSAGRRPAGRSPSSLGCEFDILETRRRGARQPHHRPPSRARPEDGAQPRVQRVRQDPGHRPAPRHRPHARRPRHLTVGTVGVMLPDATDVRATIKLIDDHARASTPGATTASASSSSRCTTRPTRSGTA